MFYAVEQNMEIKLVLSVEINQQKTLALRPDVHKC